MDWLDDLILFIKIELGDVGSFFKLFFALLVVAVGFLF